MKKAGLILTAILCCTMSWAANYGILVNGKMYFVASYEGPDPYGEGFDQYLSHVKVADGDYLQLYDYDNKAAWAVDLNPASTAGFVRSGDRYTASVTGCYDFYIKLKYEADELYIGPAGEGVVCGDGQDIDAGPIDPGYAGSAPANCPDVILQAFYWDSYQDKGHGRTKWVDFLNKTVTSGDTVAVEMAEWFDLIWLPPMSKATGGTGYIPTNYSNLDGDWGTKKNLVKMIDLFHRHGARVIADIVLNHFSAEQGYCTKFGTFDFGEYGTYIPDGSYICNTDEMNFEPAAGACKGQATGNADDGYGDEANYASARDFDHTNPDVRAMSKAYLKWLRNDIKVDGFRYDYCKGFHNSHIDDYNKAAEAYFSVMEMWDGNPDVLMSHLQDAAWNTLTFDFALKYQAFNNGIASDYYCGLKEAGLPGRGKGRYAVTFLDSHDSYQRDGNEFCGLGNSFTVCYDKILQCYAYLLSMPGVPLVFWPHWVEPDFKEPIKAMINARYKTGVHSESTVSDDCGNGYYKATITGTNGKIRLLVGPSSGYNTAPAGYTLASKGTNYGVYYKMDTPRGDKNTERQDRTQGVEEVQGDNVQGTKGEKFIQNGQLYIRCGEKVYDIMGRNVK